MSARKLISALLVAFLIGLSSKASYGASKSVLNDWFALGSGCRAKSDLPGNVRMEGIPAEAGVPDRYKVKFVFSDFTLRGERVDPGVEKFGRECAVRLNINPPEGKRIVGIRARTKVIAAKDVGPSLDILSELKLGAVSLGKVQRRLDSAARVSVHEDIVDIEAGEGATDPLPQLGCGEPKIIGFDYSWVATRAKNQKIFMTVDLSREKSLVIDAILSDCK